MRGIASRIDRLPADEKDLLQIVAVIGTEFSLGVARAVSGKSEDELNRMLNDLQLAEFVYEQPAVGEVEYTFKHALTHDVAYNSLLMDHRRVLHERAGQAIEAVYPEQLEDHSTELAHHFDHGGNIPKAVEYLGRAGFRAAQQVAHSEAIPYFTRALELLRCLPDGAVRDRQELDLQMALSWSLLVAVGFGLPQRGSALVRAGELCERLEDDAKLMEALLALAQFRLIRREVELARELAERVLAMAQEAKAPTMLAGAHYILGLVQFLTGQFPPARENLERAVELFGAGSYRSYDAFFVQTAPQMVCAVLGVLGYPSKALRKADELLAVVRRSSDPSLIANALFAYGMERLALRDTRMVAERADEMISIATEYGMAFILNAAIFFRGWAMAAAGRVDGGISEMRRSISDPMVGGFNLVMHVALAETCGKHGRAEEGLDLVAAALATAEQTGHRMAEAELYRVKGELLMIKDRSNVAEAERCLRSAIDVARRQSARLFELRATMSLARLIANRGHRDEARAMLTDIYNWFTEGFDLADLKRVQSIAQRAGRLKHILGRHGKLPPEIRNLRAIAAKHNQIVERESKITNSTNGLREAAADHIRQSRAELNE